MPRFQTLYSQFLDYRGQVPVCGAVLLNESADKCVLVRGWKSRSWGFPKGKINQHEKMVECAVREVLEEVGYDCSSKINEHLFVEGFLKDTKVRLYVISGVPETHSFMTRTRKEIREIKWFDIKYLPSDEKSDSQDAARFWSIVPFLHRLRHLLHKLKSSSKRPPVKSLPKSRSSSDSDPTESEKSNRSVRILSRSQATNQSSDQLQSLKILSVPPTTCSADSSDPFLNFRFDTASILKPFAS